MPTSARSPRHSRPAAAGAALSRPGGASPAPRRRRSAALHAALGQDRRLPRGLRLLPAERALRDAGLRPRSRWPSPRCSTPPAARAPVGRHALLHGRGLARGQGRPGVRPRPRRWCAACATLGMEACVTLGMLNDDQARRLKEAGLDRLQPQPRHLARALQVDHLHPHLRRPPGDARARAPRRHHRVLAAASSAWASRSTIAARCCARWPTLDPQPESVPINALVATPRARRWRRCRRSIRSSWCA